MTPRFDGRGILPASTTPFDARGHVDGTALRAHLRALVNGGVDGVVVLGSLGEGASLNAKEKHLVVSEAVRTVGGSVPVIASVASAHTQEAVRMARAFAREGVGGLMVLPPLVHNGDAREVNAHVTAVVRATALPCMLYNNPAAYGADLLPEQIAGLARRLSNLVAVKESSGDVRRITALRHLLPARRVVSVGLDDAVLEAARAGAEGWVAGLANALPEESVELWRLCRDGPEREADRLYRWFLPLLRMDADPKFVQMIKEVERLAGRGNGRVRPPRLELTPEERGAVASILRRRLRSRPRPTPASRATAGRVRRPTTTR